MSDNENQETTPPTPKYKKRRFTRRIDFFVNENESVSIDLFNEEEAIKLCVSLTRAGHNPSLYKLDKNDDGILIAAFELIR